MAFDVSAYGRTIPWWQALDDFKKGNPAPLADLLRTEPVPDLVRETMADAVAAAPLKRSLNADKRKGTTANRARAVSALRYFDFLWGRADTESLADELRMESQEVVATIAALRRRLHERLSKETGLAVDTIRKLPVADKSR